MALDKAALETDLKRISEDANAHEWTPEQCMAALAAAIDRFVRGAAVTGITVTVGGVKCAQDTKGKVE